MTERHGKGGQSARLMASKRHLRVLFYAGVMIVLLTLWLTNLSRIIHLGPAAIGLAVAFIGIIEFLNRKGMYTKKRAKHAERGARTEEIAREQLGELPEGYWVFNDVLCGNFNIDHIVVGPGGIFVIETKSHWGTVTTQGDCLFLNGRPPQKNFLNQVWSQTYYLWDFLKEHTSRAWSIEPILCFTKALVQVSGPVKGVRVINIRYLRRYLLSRYRVLSDEEIKHLAGLLQQRISEYQVQAKDREETGLHGMATLDGRPERIGGIRS